MLAAAKKTKRAGWTNRPNKYCVPKKFLGIGSFSIDKRFQKGTFLHSQISDLAVAQNLLVSQLADSWKLKRWVRRRRRRNPGRLKMTTGGAAHRPRHNLTEVQNFVAASVIPASGPSARDLRFDRSKISLLLLSLSSSADPSLPCQDLNLNP